MSQGETGKTGAKGEEGAAGVAGAAGAEGAVGRTGLQGEAGPASLLDPAVAKEIKTGLRTLIIATVVLYIVLFGVIIWAYIDSGNRRDAIAQVAVTTKKALCTFRHDLQLRIQASEQFLKDNPNGIVGITAEQIRQSLINQKQTVESLEDLRCP